MLEALCTNVMSFFIKQFTTNFVEHSSGKLHRLFYIDFCSFFSKKSVTSIAIIFLFLIPKKRLRI